MKTIRTLVKDIYGLFGSGHKATPEDVKELAEAMAVHVNNALATREPRGTLRASIIGTKCKRKLWFDVNRPETAEALEPWTKLKFLYGNLLEEIILFLAKEAGHDVQKRQAEVKVNGVKGHIDGIIDGVLCDVKSASGYGMAKFREHRLEHDDPFGYKDQITFYNKALQDELTIKGEGAFLAVDKSNGQLVLDSYPITEYDRKKLVEKVDQSIDLVNSDDLPDRGFSDLPDGSSGNRRLCMECSYCPYKEQCWSGLRKFIYSTGPRWLTRVGKEPNVPEDTNWNSPRTSDGTGKDLQ